MPDTVHQLLRDSEENYLNTSFWEVHPLFLMVQNGETDQLGDRLHLQLERFPSGRISRDERKQLEYLTVSLVNTFMIAAIQGGVYPPDANAAADRALRRLSQSKSAAEIPPIVNEAALRLCKMVRDTKLHDTGNVHVEKAKQYLSTHLTQEIRTEDIAAAVSRAESQIKTETRKTGSQACLPRYFICWIQLSALYATRVKIGVGL